MLALILLLVLPMQAGSPETIQPTTRSSPSGEWTLSVDPSSKFGVGPAHVEVSHHGQLAWKADVPFTFWDALITDAGCAAGYAFTEGRSFMAAGQFVVAIFAPDGRELLDDRIDCTDSPYPDGPPDPRPLGLFAQPDLDRFVVRLSDADVNRQNEEWWTYRASTGEKLGHLQPKSLIDSGETLIETLGARPILGTPLTLVQWYHVDFDAPGGEELGTRFVLVGDDWKPVWTLALPRDYGNADDAEQDRLLNEAWKQGGILDASQPGRFELRHVADKERVTYEVVADPKAEHGWTVREAARAPWSAAAADAALPVVALRQLATVPLETGASHVTTPIRDIEAFDFDAKGNLRLVRREKASHRMTLLSIGADGAVLGQAALDELAPDVEAQRKWFALGGNRWLFTLSPFGPDVVSRAWFVNATTGAASELEGFSGPSVEAVRAAPDGGFVVLGGYYHKSSINAALLAFDAAGTRRWEKVEAGHVGAPDELGSDEDVAVEADGSILVLDTVGKRVQVFRADGQFERVVRLDPSWADDDSYPSELRVEPDGHWLVRDSDGVGTWHRLGRDGLTLASFHPRRESGSTDVGSSGAVRVDPKGVLWGTDGQELFTFDGNGVAHTQFGTPPDADALGEPGRIHFDGQGRIAIEDRRTHSVHLFAPSGARVLVLHPEPTDFDDPMAGVCAVVTAPDGRVFVRTSDYADRYLEFATDGRRVGPAQLGGERVAFVPGRDGRWAAQVSAFGPATVSRLGPQGDERVKLDRRPNHDFFRAILATGCGPDGSLSVLTGSDGDQGPFDLDLFAPDGKPLRSIDLPAVPRGWWNDLSHGSRWIVASSFTNEAILVPLSGGRPALVRVGEEAGRQDCAFTLSPDGTELWCASCDPPELDRFAPPE